MARKKRIHYFNAMYHVMMRGNYRQNIFLNDDDRLYFYSLLEKAVEKFECKIHLFCLMNNHVHLVIEVKYVPLCKIIQSVSTAFAKYNNKRTSRSGHLFQGRYKAKLIQDEKYLLELCDYIHRNPLKAKIVGDLNYYSWSSHLNYLSKKNLKWLTTDFINSILKKHSHHKENYYFHFFQNRTLNFSEPVFCELDEQGLLIIKDSVNRNSIPEQSLHLDNLSIKEISEVVCAYFNLKIDILDSEDHSQLSVLARSLTTYFAHYYGNYYLNDIAYFIGRKPNSLGKIVHRYISLQSTKKHIRALEHQFVNLIADKKNRI